MLSATETATIHDAMTKAAGERASAAEILGITEQALADKIRSNRNLATLWIAKKGELSIEDAYTRTKHNFDIVDPVDIGVSPRAAAVASAFAQEENKLQKVDWEGLGVSDPKALSLMAQFEQGVGRGVLRMMDTMQGGMAFCFARVSRQFADVAEELDKIENERDLGKPVDDAKVMVLHMRFMDLAKLMQSFNREATNAAHTRLLIADRAKKMQNAGSRLRKLRPLKQVVETKANASP